MGHPPWEDDPYPDDERPQPERGPGVSDDVLPDEDSSDDLDHLRGDVRRGARPTLTRDCPGDCDGETTHTLFQQYPAVATTGAWGKYLNPVYRCDECGHAHTLLMYETPSEADRPEWGEYPPEADVDGPVTARKLVHDREEGRDA